MPEFLKETQTNTKGSTQTTATFVPTSPEPTLRSNTRRNIFIISFVVVLVTAAVAATLILEKNDFTGISSIIRSIQGPKVSDDTAKHVVESLFSIRTTDMEIDMKTSGPMFSSTSSVSSKIFGRFDPKGGENGSYELSYELQNANGNLITPTSFHLINVASNTYFQAEGLPTLFLISDALNGNWINLSQNLAHANFHYPSVNKDQMAKSLADNHVFSLSKTLGNETVNEVKTNHFSLNVNQEGFENFAKTFFQELDSKLSDEDVKKIADSIHFNNVEVWVGVNDFFPYKILLDVNTVKNADVHIEDGTLSAAIIFSKLNEDKNIAAPKNSMTLPEALTPQIQGFVGGLFDKAIGNIFQQFPAVNGLPDSDGDGVNDASEIILGTDSSKQDTNGNGVSDKEELSAKLGDPRDADSDGLSDTLEGFFGTDLNKSDSDGDGFSDGNEVLNGFNPKGPGKLFP